MTIDPGGGTEWMVDLEGWGSNLPVAGRGLGKLEQRTHLGRLESLAGELQLEGRRARPSEDALGRGLDVRAPCDPEETYSSAGICGAGFIFKTAKSKWEEHSQQNIAILRLRRRVLSNLAILRLRRRVLSHLGLAVGEPRLGLRNLVLHVLHHLVDRGVDGSPPIVSGAGDLECCAKENAKNGCA